MEDCIILDEKMRKDIELLRRNAAIEIKALIRRSMFWNDDDYDNLMKEINRRFKIYDN